MADLAQVFPEKIDLLKAQLQKAPKTQDDSLVEVLKGHSLGAAEANLRAREVDAVFQAALAPVESALGGTDVAAAVTMLTKLNAFLDDLQAALRPNEHQIYFEEKHIIVTGGSANGIGRATVEELLLYGTNVTVFDIADLPPELKGLVNFKKVNLTDPKQIFAAVQDACEKDFGGKLHGIACIAGIEPKASRKHYHEFFEADGSVDSILDNVRDVAEIGTHATAAAGRKYMLETIGDYDPEKDRERSASVVVTSSVQATQPDPGTYPHVVECNSRIGFARAAAAGDAQHGIRFNTLMFGTVESETVMGSLDEDQGGKAANAMAHPRQVRCTTREAARSYLHLLNSMASPNTIGAEIMVSGGHHLHAGHTAANLFGPILKRHGIDLSGTQSQD